MNCNKTQNGLFYEAKKKGLKSNYIDLTCNKTAKKDTIINAFNAYTTKEIRRKNNCILKSSVTSPAQHITVTGPAQHIIVTGPAQHIIVTGPAQHIIVTGHGP